MVVEHTFVTTLGLDAAMEQAWRLLTARGFATGTTGAPRASHLELRRGTAKAAQAKSVSELPQVVRMDFDRGRVTVAVSIEASATWGGASSWGGVSERSQKMTLHARLLTAIANALEGFVARNLPAAEATAEWDDVERDVADAAQDIARRKRRRLIILLSVLAMIVAGLVALVVYN